jgi:hypothetical protein
MNRKSQISRWVMFLILSLLLTVSCAPRRETFEIKNKRFLLNGQPFSNQADNPISEKKTAPMKNNFLLLHQII